MSKRVRVLLQSHMTDYAFTALQHLHAVDVTRGSRRYISATVRVCRSREETPRIRHNMHTYTYENTNDTGRQYVSDTTGQFSFVLHAQLQLTESVR